MNLSDTQKELIHTLKEFEIPEEMVIGILLLIDTDNQAIELMEWLVKNPYATHAKILDQVDIINPNPKNVERS